MEDHRLRVFARRPGPGGAEVKPVPPGRGHGDVGVEAKALETAQRGAVGWALAASLPFNGASIIARYTVDRGSPDKVTTEQANKTVKVITK